MTAQNINFDSIFSKEQIEYIMHHVTEQAKEVFGDKLCDVILYGSYARGDFGEWSDVDIMILADTDELTVKRLDRELTERLFDLDFRMNMLLSIIVVPFTRFDYFKEHYPFYKNVREEGVSMYLMKSK